MTVKKVASFVFVFFLWGVGKGQKKKKTACLIRFCKKWPENLIPFFFPNGNNTPCQKKFFLIDVKLKHQ